MPSHPTRHTIARQWQLLKLLPGRHPGMSSTQLQAALTTVGHTTSKRTVERDLVELAALFPLQCNSKGMPYGWYWQPGLSLREAQQLQPDVLTPRTTLNCMPGSMTRWPAAWNNHPCQQTCN